MPAGSTPERRAVCGALVVLGGDLRQTLPVLELADRIEIAACAITQIRLWRLGVVERRTLSRNQRAAADRDCRDFLLKIGEGRLPFDIDAGPYSVPLPREICLPANTSTDAAFLQLPLAMTWLRMCTRICPTLCGDACKILISRI